MPKSFFLINKALYLDSSTFMYPLVQIRTSGYAMFRMYRMFRMKCIFIIRYSGDFWKSTKVGMPPATYQFVHGLVQRDHGE